MSGGVAGEAGEATEDRRNIDAKDDSRKGVFSDRGGSRLDPLPPIGLKPLLDNGMNPTVRIGAGHVMNRRSLRFSRIGPNASQTETVWAPFAAAFRSQSACCSARSHSV
jgi:hypothetical protein